jgi:adhesin HecA-like repeat protein
MNRKTYRLVYSRLRGMLVAVEETATATAKQAGQTTVRSRKSQGVIFSLRQIAFAALALLGALPSLSGAQIIPGGAHAPSVIQTQNGLDQVNINRPSGAGVSMNTYGQFDVQPKGAILNNSPVIVQTQQAGMINGNPNFGPGQSARVIVNQVILAGSSTSANGALALTASGGDLNLSGATTTSGGALDTRASGTLTNDGGVLSSGGAQTVTAGALSNRNGQIVSGSTLNVTAASDLLNQGGTLQAAGALSVNAGALDNTGGHVAALGVDGLTLAMGGLLNNGSGGTGAGTIGGNGNVTVQAGQIANAGSITAVQSLIASAVQTLFNSGTLAANGTAAISARTSRARRITSILFQARRCRVPVVSRWHLLRR